MTLVTYSRPVAALEAAYSRIHGVLGTRAAAHDPAMLLATVHDEVDGTIAVHEAAGHLEEVDHAALASAALARLGIAADAETVDAILEIEQEAWWQGMHVAPGVAGALQRLRDSGLRVGLCSNAPYRAASLHGQIAHLGLRDCFDATVFSSEIRWRKPASQMFTATLERMQTSAATTVMVGDRCREDIGGAHLSGLRAIRLREHFDDVDCAEPAELVADHLSDVVETLLNHRRL